MWTTPAPPSTAFVAASICPGTGDVNTSPGAAASSMPSPTNPPCRGSCPDPPPEIKATLPFLGESLRTMIWFVTSYRSRSGWAAASPFKDSLTTSAGSLRNLRIWPVSTAILVFLLSVKDLAGGRARGVVVADRRHDRPLDQSWVGNVVVEEGRGGRADEARNQVDGKVLGPEGRAARDRLHQLGAECARRVERGASYGSEDEDDPYHRSADHDAGELRGRLRVDDAEDREDEQSGADGLGQHGLHVVPGRSVGRKVGLAHAERHRVVCEDTPDRKRAEDGAGVLGDPVDRDFLPREALGHRQRERDGRVDVAARDLADRVHKRGDDEPEREADRQEVCLGDRRHGLAGQRERGDHRTRTDQDQCRRTEELGNCALWHRMHLAQDPLCLTSVRQCRTDFTNRSPVRTVCQQVIWTLQPSSPAWRAARALHCRRHTKPAIGIWYSPPGLRPANGLPFCFYAQADRDHRHLD